MEKIEATSDSPLAEFQNLVNASRIDECENDGTTIQMHLVRCASNLVSSYGIMPKTNPEIWSPQYFGEATTIAQTAQRHLPAHVGSPPLEEHIKILQNYDMCTSLYDFGDADTWEIPGVKPYFEVTTTFFLLTENGGKTTSSKYPLLW